MLVISAAVGGCGYDRPLQAPNRTEGSLAPPAPAQAPLDLSTGSLAAGRAPGETIKLGKHEVDLSPVYDRDCKRLVAPHDTSESLKELARVVAGSMVQMSKEALAGSLDQYLAANKPAAGRAEGKLAAGQAVKDQIVGDVVRAAKRLNWLPMSVEVEYGKGLLKRREAEIAPRDGRKSRVRYEKGEALLAELVSQVQEPHDYKFQLVVLNEGGTNAEALPGGFVLIQSGLISDKGELHPKARFALSHEIGHVLQRHHTQDLQARVVDALAVRASAKDLLATVKGADKNPQALVALLSSGMNLLDGHSIEQEFQSDACGVRLLQSGQADRRRWVPDVRAFADTLSAGKPRAFKPVEKTGGTPAEMEAANLAYRVIERFSDLGQTHPDDGLRRQRLLTLLGEPAPAKAATTSARPAPRPATAASGPSARAPAPVQPRATK